MVIPDAVGRKETHATPGLEGRSTLTLPNFSWKGGAKAQQKR